MEKFTITLYKGIKSKDIKNVIDVLIHSADRDGYSLEIITLKDRKYDHLIYNVSKEDFWTASAGTINQRVKSCEQREKIEGREVTFDEID